MQDILLKGLSQAATNLCDNLDKKAHVQDVVRRLEAASESYPYDFVIRSMEDVFKKRAAKNPHHLVTADEFESVRSDLWGLNPNSTIKELFPDLTYGQFVAQSEPRDYVYADESARHVAQSDANVVETARELVLAGLTNAGIGYAQTRFGKGMYTSYDAFGNPTDGVLLFTAAIITKNGEATVSVPVTLENGSVIAPDSFACNTMRYPLSKKGTSDFSLGIEGLKTDTAIPQEYTFAENEVRDIPSVDDTGQNLLNEAKQKVFLAFRDAGVNNCQIHLKSFDVNSTGDGGIFGFKVDLPFSNDEVLVPVSVDQALIYSPFEFSANDGQQFALNSEGVQQYIATSKPKEDTKLASLVHQDTTIRELKPAASENYRSLVAEKLAGDLRKFGAVSPQVFYITGSSTGKTITAAFMASFNSKKGLCQIAIPIRIEGSSVKTPREFVAEDEKRYSFSSDGLDYYVGSKTGYKRTPGVDTYGEHSSESLADNEIDLTAKSISRQEGFESKSRVLGQADKSDQVIDSIRSSLAQTLASIGAVNPQVQFVKKEDRENEAVLRFIASFTTPRGVKKAQLPVLVSNAGIRKPDRFLGDDQQAYALTTAGLYGYVEASAATTDEVEKEITSKLNLMSYDKLRSFAKEALEAGDHLQLSSAMSALNERFGAEAAKNCFADLTEEASKRNVVSKTQCGECPFFRAGSTSGARTTEDRCLKFQTQVASVRVASHHSQCQLIRNQAEEKHFDGSIVQSQIKLT